MTRTDIHGLEVLDDHICFQFLAEQPLGRLGFSSGALPVIFPVNYTLEGTTVFIGTEDGEKTHAARNGSVACLEIDRFDTMGHEGWSVLATGRLRVVDDEEQGRVEQLPLTPWVIGGLAPMYIAMQIELVSGRRIRHAGH